VSQWMLKGVEWMAGKMGRNGWMERLVRGYRDDVAGVIARVKGLVFELPAEDGGVMSVRNPRLVVDARHQLLYEDRVPLSMEPLLL
jgi:hypothetical protein